MQKKALVLYASKHGATREIAEKVYETLKASGVEADLANAAEKMDLSSYSTIVLGSAVYVGQWQKPAVSFLKNNAADLSSKDVWIFSSGPSDKGDPVELLNGWRFPKSVQEQIDQIGPKGIAVFHGNLDPSELNFMEKFMIKQVKAKIGDFRDWEMITSWADQISATLVN